MFMFAGVKVVKVSSCKWSRKFINGDEQVFIYMSFFGHIVAEDRSHCGKCDGFCGDDNGADTIASLNI